MSKILLITNSENNLRTHRSVFLETCKNLGVEVDILTPERSQRLNVRGFRRTSFTITTVYDVTRMVLRNKIVLIVSFTMVANFMAIIVRKFTPGIKIISNITGLGSVYISQSYKSIIIRKVLNQAWQYSDLLIVQNITDYNYFRKKNVKETVLINGSGFHPVTLVKSRRKSDEILKLVFVGRLIREKGINDLMNAVDKFYNNYSEKIELHIYGEIDKSNPSSLTEAEFDRMLSKSYVRYHGYLEDFSFSFIDVDFCVLPSYREGASMTIIESLANGIPVITSDRPGCGDLLIGSNKNTAGYSFNLEDKSAFLNILIEASEMGAEKWNNMSKEATILFNQRFSAKEIQSSYEKVIKLFI